MTVEFHELEIAAVTRETAECASYELSVPPELRALYRYRAGQHLTFELPWGDFKVTRCYSLSSCPDLREPLKIAVKRVEGGRVSNWINDNLAVGDKVRASVPEGRFVLDPETRAGAPLFLFAGGSGITPIISLLKSALVTTKRSISLVYANQDPDTVIYADELDRVLGEHPGRLTVHNHYDSAGGYLTSEMIRQYLHDHAAHSRESDIIDTAEFYICGPGFFMELVENALSEAGVHQELVYIERFVSPTDPDQPGRHLRDAQSFESPDRFSLWLDGRSRSVPYLHGKTLLECAQAAGLNPARSCESGFCGSCMAHVKTGQVYMRTHEALSERDIAKGVALLCQSIPASSEPLEVDADSTSFRTASAVKSSYGKRASQLAAAAVFAFMVAGTLVLRLVH